MNFNIIDNAVDSLNYALDYYTKYLDGHKNWNTDDFDMDYYSFLKMSLLLTHHATELLMKKVLLNVDELLIYDNLSDNKILDI